MDKGQGTRDNEESGKNPSRVFAKLGIVHRPSSISVLYGLVLAGGRSTRMGTDKGALSYHGRPQVEHCFELLSPFCAEVFVSTRPGQPTTGHPEILDRFAGEGPWVGIVSAMTIHPNAAWLVLACDMPFVDGRVLEKLIRARDPSKVATAYRANDGRAEPLCAIYEPRACRLLTGGNGSLRHVLSNAPVVLVDPDRHGLLANVNRLDERSLVLETLTAGRGA